ncbi:MAG: hypothetical protein IPN88_14995 [Bacteroidetes bacterium]|nr:hypothetical protein [Bacteroidota bacterium]
MTNGTRSAIVHVMNDDCDEADYNFSVQGTALTSVIGNYPSASINAGGSITITQLQFRQILLY